MCKTLTTATLAILLAAPLQPTAAADRAPPLKVAFGDTPAFWDEYALVVATVVGVEDFGDGLDGVASDVTLSVRQSVPARFPPDTRLTVTFWRSWRLGPVRDRPQSATTLAAGDRVMLMAANEKGKPVAALPSLRGMPVVDPFEKEQKWLPQQVEVLTLGLVKT